MYFAFLSTVMSYLKAFSYEQEDECPLLFLWRMAFLTNAWLPFDHDGRVCFEMKTPFYHFDYLFSQPFSNDDKTCQFISLPCASKVMEILHTVSRTYWFTLIQIVAAEYLDLFSKGKCPPFWQWPTYLALNAPELMMPTVELILIIGAKLQLHSPMFIILCLKWCFS